MKLSKLKIALIVLLIYCVSFGPTYLIILKLGPIVEYRWTWLITIHELVFAPFSIMAYYSETFFYYSFGLWSYPHTKVMPSAGDHKLFRKYIERESTIKSLFS
jgi:hypothetical protein